MGLIWILTLIANWQHAAFLQYPATVINSMQGTSLIACSVQPNRRFSPRCYLPLPFVLPFRFLSLPFQVKEVYISWQKCYNCLRSQVSRVSAVLIALLYDINEGSCFTGFFYYVVLHHYKENARSLQGKTVQKMLNHAQTNIAQCAVKTDPKITTESNTLSMTTKSQDNHGGQ